MWWWYYRLWWLWWWLLIIIISLSSYIVDVINTSVIISSGYPACDVCYFMLSTLTTIIIINIIIINIVIINIIINTISKPTIIPIIPIIPILILIPLLILISLPISHPILLMRINIHKTIQLQKQQKWYRLKILIMLLFQWQVWKEYRILMLQWYQHPYVLITTLL